MQMGREASNPAAGFGTPTTELPMPPTKPTNAAAAAADTDTAAAGDKRKADESGGTAKKPKA